MGANLLGLLSIAACATELPTAAPTELPNDAPTNTPVKLAAGELHLVGAPPEGTFAVVYPEDPWSLSKTMSVVDLDGEVRLTITAKWFDEITAGEGVYFLDEDYRSFGWWPALDATPRAFAAGVAQVSPDGTFVLGEDLMGPRGGPLDPVPGVAASAGFAPVSGHFYFDDAEGVMRVPAGHRVVDAQRLCGACRLADVPGAFAPDGDLVLTLAGTDGSLAASVWSTDGVGEPPLATFALPPDVSGAILGPAPLVAWSHRDHVDVDPHMDTWHFVVHDYVAGLDINQSDPRRQDVVGMSRRFVACKNFDDADPFFGMVYAVGGMRWYGLAPQFGPGDRLVIATWDDSGNEALVVATPTTAATALPFGAVRHSQWMDDRRLLMNLSDGALAWADVVGAPTVATRVVTGVAPTGGASAPPFAYVPATKRLFYVVSGESPSTDGLYTMLLR